MTKKKKRLTPLQRERANIIARIFNCWSFEPDVCGICAAIEELVLLGKRK